MLSGWAWVDWWLWDEETRLNLARHFSRGHCSGCRGCQLATTFSTATLHNRTRETHEATVQVHAKCSNGP
jgi:hypothetical protein